MSKIPSWHSVGLKKGNNKFMLVLLVIVFCHTNYPTLCQPTVKKGGPIKMLISGFQPGS